ncbi:MAG: sialate O-acetylesterase [Bacteroidales bacterium]|nr:sialate O-acetylesterase [Bacteroidales bacterium]
MSSLKSLLAAAFAIGCAANANAAITLPEIIGDNMVLQQCANARLWGWATPGAKVTVTPQWNGTPYEATAGSDGRWDIAVATPAASMTPYSIKVTGDGSDIDINNVLVGEVWLCSGQSNMEMPLRGFWGQPVEGAAQAIAYSGKHPGVRMVNIPKSEAKTPQATTPGKWKTSCPQNAPEFSALAYFFAVALNDILDVPVGIINCSYGGTKAESWLPREVVATYPDFDVDAEIAGTSGADDWHRAVVRYNSMLHPIVGYTIKGVCWNQGESNVGKHDTYPQRMADIQKTWANLWGMEDMPFYQVEIPGWNYGNPDGDDAAKFRECQHKAAAMMPHGGIVSTTDLMYPYELEDIHASQKQPIGERLAFLAAADVYGINEIPHEFPQYESMDVQGDKAILKFKNAENHLSPNDDLPGFEVAGTDHVFHPAKAIQTWDTYDVIVYKPEECDSIESIRYCFKNFAIGQVHNMLGLPLVPFRTDSW